MDRNKPIISRPGKPKIGVPHHGSEIFALGSKSTASSSVRDDMKSKVMSSSSSSSKSSGSDRKRDAPTPPSSIVSKKPKLSGLPGTSQTATVPSSATSSSHSRSFDGSGSQHQEYWEQVARDCDSADLVQSVLAAIDKQDSDTVVALICGAIKSLIKRRTE